MGIKYIDAKRLRRVLIGGGKWIKKHEKHLNDLNVYPVPDGDTGTNMSMTVQTMIDEITSKTNDKTDMSTLADIVEDAVLIGARGNSGTILSQIITGFLKSVKDKKRLKPTDVADALISAKELAYKVVDTPVEGTMLTVIRMVADKSNELREVETFNEFIEGLVEKANEAVELTPDLLPKLKEAGVVDSGGKGLMYFFIGMYKILTEIELLTKASVVESEYDTTILSIDHNDNDIKFKFCTEFIIKINENFEMDQLKSELLELGDSAVFAASSKKFKVHIHTNNPVIVIDKACNSGELEKVKIENMKIQNENVLQMDNNARIFVNKNKYLRKDAYVILADTIALKDEFLKLGADVVILGGQGQNPSVNDILTAVSKVEGYSNIYILPNNKNVISTANLAMEKTNIPLIVIPTKTMLEGMFYLRYPKITMEEKGILNNLNSSVEITKAVRSTTVDGMKIEEGDYLILVNTKIKFVAKTLQEAIDKVLDNLVNENTLTLTVVEGQNLNEEIREKISKLNSKLTEKVHFIEGKQESYDYYIYVENKDENQPEVAILTDSSSDLTPMEVIGKNITIISTRMDCDGVEYRDEENINKQEFWRMLVQEDKTFRTAQPSPKDIVNTYNDIFRRGYKKILVIPLSSKLSGTQNVLKLAREMIKKEKEIVIYDSKAISVQLGYMVTVASRLIAAKKGIEETIIHLDKLREKIKLYIVVDSLKYLHRGGRISKTAQTIGDFLNMKPIISIANGALYVEKKVFGGESAVNRYIEKVVNDTIKQHSIYLGTGAGGTNNQIEQATKILDEFKQNRRVTVISPIKEIGATVGTHAGPVYGVLIIPKLL